MPVALPSGRSGASTDPPAIELPDRAKALWHQVLVAGPVFDAIDAPVLS